MDNIKKLQDALASLDMDGLLITGEPNRFYATGFPSSDGVALITPEESFFFTDSRYIEAAEMAIRSATVLPVDKSNSYVSRINAVLGDMNITRLGIEEQTLTVAEYRHYKEELTAELVFAQQVMTDLRAVKTPEELDWMIKAQRISEKALEEVLPMISVKLTERELAAELLYRMLRLGAEDKSFDPIVVSAEKSSMPHGVPGNVKIKEGFLTMDFGCKFGGYCSDMTRTVCVGEPTAEMRKVYDTVLAAQLAGIEAARAGVTGAAIDGAARQVIADAGYGEYFGHSFGHGVGIEIHEAPNAAPSYTKLMPAGAVISAEPGIYLPGRFGVRIEDVVYLQENGCVDITLAPKELICL